MKKLLVLLLALITVLAMVACGNTDETTLPADDATDPVETEPVATEPAETEPVVTEPVETEPVETEPVETEPVETVLAFKSYVCPECGAEVEEADLEVLLKRETLRFIDGTKRFDLPADVVGEDKAVYQVDFTVTFKTMSAMGASELYNSGNGRNFMNYNTPDITTFLRQYPVSNGEGGYREDQVMLVVKSGGTYLADLAILTVGDSVAISLVANPAASSVEVYANGVLVGTANYKNYFKQTQFRFGDNAASCDFAVSDFRVVRAAAAAHTH